MTMSDFGLRDPRDNPLVPHVELSSAGRWAMAMGVVALLLGLAAAAGGAYVGLGGPSRLMSLPLGLPAAESGVVGLFMIGCGALTMLLGAISIYKAHDA
ncbi:hypothetical protein GXW78_27335 [Roseomonas terrae]|jgi:hypothetical protein|uniref:Cox cluster protein n=1 Tax=Neoroseomonas terrae TaxID=424799 RepID=A0ABS5EQU4_9PROT|nr:hypothetical protein [Neoroseomonas terrae]MBR0653394.1 hypothetical protein [Neoroseomonas terrae]